MKMAKTSIRHAKTTGCAPQIQEIDENDEMVGVARAKHRLPTIPVPPPRRLQFPAIVIHQCCAIPARPQLLQKYILK